MDIIFRKKKNHRLSLEFLCTSAPLLQARYEYRIREKWNLERSKEMDRCVEGREWTVPWPEERNPHFELE